MKSVSKLPFRLSAVASVLLLVGQQAVAHHSYAMFDRQKVMQYTAVVRTWEFVNPHAYLWVYINAASGEPQLWGLEAPGPTVLFRSGWKKNSVKPGDKITVWIHPLRDGRNGGSLVKLIAPDGRAFEAGELPGAPGGDSALNNGPEAHKTEAPKK